MTNFKKLKMIRTFITSLLLTLMAISFIIGCSKTNNEAELNDPLKLSEDKAFIEFATETYDYLLFISDKVKQNSLSLPELQTQISNLQSKNLSFNEQMTSIDLIFKGAISQRLNEHMKAYNSSWNSIKSHYGTITLEIMEKECAEVLSNKFSKKNKTQNTSSRVALVDDCGWRYYLCAGAATAGAVLCHAGCDTTALATTAGLGIPLCVVACGTLQAYSIVLCSDSYCN